MALAGWGQWRACGVNCGVALAIGAIKGYMRAKPMSAQIVKELPEIGPRLRPAAAFAPSPSRNCRGPDPNRLTQMRKAQDA